MSRIHLEDCALEYAGYWTDNEHSFVTALAGSDKQQRLAALQRAGGYFKISRNFKRTYDVGAGLVPHFVQKVTVWHMRKIKHLQRSLVHFCNDFAHFLRFSPSSLFVPRQEAT
jgi:hypothetical protein